MLPIAPLMIEHRLIEKMIAVIKKAIAHFEQQNIINPGFIDFFEGPRAAISHDRSPVLEQIILMYGKTSGFDSSVISGSGKSWCSDRFKDLSLRSSNTFSPRGVILLS